MTAFVEWLHSAALGRYLLAQEQEYFDRAVTDAFGFRAVQFGLAAQDLLRANRMPWHAVIGDGEGAGVVCEPAALPLDSRSLDLLLLPHTLDFAAHPHQVLREAERVLVPEGRLVLTGFNPMSAWGARRLLQGAHKAPWSGRFLRLSRLRDWLELMGFEAAQETFLCYAPPFNRCDWLARCQSLESVGARWFPLVAGVYGISAIKRQRGMRVITPGWQVASPASQLAVLGEHRHAACHPHDETL